MNNEQIITDLQAKIDEAIADIDLADAIDVMEGMRDHVEMVLSALQDDLERNKESDG